MTYKIVKGVSPSSSDLDIKPAGSIVTIGNFDGVHLGHRQIMNQVMELAGDEYSSIVFTFRPHPQLALRPEKSTPLLMSYDEKIQAIGELGIQIIIEQPFSREFSNTSPKDFFDQVIVGRLRAKKLIVGYDFAFGRDREGHADQLKKMCEQNGVEMIIVPPFEVGGKIVSSTRIRKCLLHNQVEKANAILGHRFFYSGVVSKGDQRGRHIGFATANIAIAEKIKLPFGVYITQTYIRDQAIASVSNLGIRPTFTQSEDFASVILETHLLDQKIDLYGEIIKVEILKHLRPEKKFDGIESLKHQIALDVMATRQYFDPSHDSY